MTNYRTKSAAFETGSEILKIRYYVEIMENTSQLHFDYFTIEATEIDGTGLETGTETHSGQEVYNIPFHHRAIVASVLIGLTLIGLLGNTLVIIAVVVSAFQETSYDHQHTGVVNLAFADV